ncbi:heterokaryon incompatibility protein-domain-containing protein [Lasiosphaeris hirsuta]|uniref:Heterokaryon incompatibility protein-domain-containing protein n=1 Tax=Lasiosphaeris hirsuta TaxID=260670 RepID=A0AA40E9M3_9PEZI|nr:heterokaryon incompatibility protein-domain-containing protein [Lasiosphaeris hirsuta]
MDVVLQHKNPPLCPGCASVDLDDAFDPCQFDNLPPLQTPGATPWTEYLRKITTFSMESVQSGKGSCRLCSFLSVVASVAEKYKVPSLCSMGLGSPRPTGSLTAMEDGDGFTLATTSSQFIYPTSLPSSNGIGAACHDVNASAWLIVIKGSDTLERVAHEYLDPAHSFQASRIPPNLLGCIASFVRNTGTWITEVHTDNISGTPTSIRGRLVIPGRVDYALMRSWLKSCLANHQSCIYSATSPVVPHMKLIDCQTHTIVAADPSMLYLALSYVWGQGPPEKYSYPSLPKSLPPTVRDSITVALELGFRYIWIDRYCIWQDDPVHKASQILNMREIYGRAVATIAASSGLDPTYGLPGVGATRCRIPHHQIVGHVGDRVLVSGAIQRRQQEAIHNSVWDTRAWTFQEAALSRRIFYFTDLEVSFLCAECEAFEHLNQPIALAHGDGNSQKSRYGVNEADGVVSLVRRYSTRSMTYSSDALDACVGVLTMWVALNDNCHHYWGIPLRFPADRGSPELCDALWRALCWRLCTGDVRSGKRRAGFPTWSWLAIDGRVQVNTYMGPRKEASNANYNFAVSTKHGDKIGWCEFVQTGGLLRSPSDWGMSLQIQGWAFEVGPFVGVTFSKPRRTMYYTKLRDSSASITSVLKFLPDFGTASPARFMFDQFEAISTCTYDNSDENFAVVFERDGVSGRRIGLLQLAERSLVEGDIPFTPESTFDMRALGARWSNVCLE